MTRSFCDHCGGQLANNLSFTTDEVFLPTPENVNHYRWAVAFAVGPSYGYKVEICSKCKNEMIIAGCKLFLERHERKEQK